MKLEDRKVDVKVYPDKIKKLQETKYFIAAVERKAKKLKSIKMAFWEVYRDAEIYHNIPPISTYESYKVIKSRHKAKNNVNKSAKH